MIKTILKCSQCSELFEQKGLEWMCPVCRDKELMSGIQSKLDDLLRRIERLERFVREDGWKQ